MRKTRPFLRWSPILVPVGALCLAACSTQPAAPKTAAAGSQQDQLIQNAYQGYASNVMPGISFSVTTEAIDSFHVSGDRDDHLRRDMIATASDHRVPYSQLDVGGQLFLRPVFMALGAGTVNAAKGNAAGPLDDTCMGEDGEDPECVYSEADDEDDDCLAECYDDESCDPLQCSSGGMHATQPGAGGGAAKALIETNPSYTQGTLWKVAVTINGETRTHSALELVQANGNVRLFDQVMIGINHMIGTSAVRLLAVTSGSRTPRSVANLEGPADGCNDWIKAYTERQDWTMHFYNIFGYELGTRPFSVQVEINASVNCVKQMDNLCHLATAGVHTQEPTATPYTSAPGICFGHLCRTWGVAARSPQPTIFDQNRPPDWVDFSGGCEAAVVDNSTSTIGTQIGGQAGGPNGTVNGSVNVTFTDPGGTLCSLGGIVNEYINCLTMSGQGGQLGGPPVQQGTGTGGAITGRD